MITYRGYKGTVEFDADNDMFHGSLKGIDAFVEYYAETYEELIQEFKYAVDDYIETAEYLAGE